MASWSFLTSHARALLCIARDPGARLRDVAVSLGIPNAAPTASSPARPQPATSSSRKDGHRNRHQIQAHLPLPEPASQEPAIGDVPAPPCRRRRETAADRYRTSLRAPVTET